MPAPSIARREGARGPADLRGVAEAHAGRDPLAVWSEGERDLDEPIRLDAGSADFLTARAEGSSWDWFARPSSWLYRQQGTLSTSASGSPAPAP